jgi:hypothetical protein
MYLRFPYRLSRRENDATISVCRDWRVSNRVDERVNIEQGIECKPFSRDFNHGKKGIDKIVNGHVGGHAVEIGRSVFTPR